MIEETRNFRIDQQKSQGSPVKSQLYEWARMKHMFYRAPYAFLSADPLLPGLFKCFKFKISYRDVGVSWMEEV